MSSISDFDKQRSELKSQWEWEMQNRYDFMPAWWWREKIGAHLPAPHPLTRQFLNLENATTRDLPPLIKSLPTAIKQLAHFCRASDNLTRFFHDINHGNNVKRIFRRVKRALHVAQIFFHVA